MKKVYVAVNADFVIDKKLPVTGDLPLDKAVLPRYFTWEDGRQYAIDRVLDIRRAASTRVGGVGLRYTVKICGRERYMWLEDETMAWFMEGRESAEAPHAG